MSHYHHSHIITAILTVNNINNYHIITALSYAVEIFCVKVLLFEDIFAKLSLRRFIWFQGF